jgi:hypothetical protein
MTTASEPPRVAGVAAGIADADIVGPSARAQAASPIIKSRFILVFPPFEFELSRQTRKFRSLAEFHFELGHGKDAIKKAAQLRRPHVGFACCTWNALPSPTPAAAPSASPTAAPPASPAAAPSKQSHDQKQQNRTDGSVDDCTDHPGTEMDTQLRQQPASDKSPQYSDDEVTKDSKTGPAYDLSCQPARNQTYKQYDQQASLDIFIVPPRHFGSRAASTS